MPPDSCDFASPPVRELRIGMRARSVYIDSTAETNSCSCVIRDW
jgi:hypothetical protein